MCVIVTTRGQMWLTVENTMPLAMTPSVDSMSNEEKMFLVGSG